MFEPTDAARIGVEFLTLWLRPGTEARHDAAAHISSVLFDEDGPGAVKIIAGLLNLNMVVLMDFMKEKGATSGDEATEMAGNYLRGLSPQLPE
jgi:hypothetical protein